MTKVSVIIPTYGKPVFLEKAIQSVIAQTMQDWELFIVDDNNPETDNRFKTEEVVSNFLADKRIHYLKHLCNKNGAAARNTGISNANGKYISFLDSDDEYLPDRLMKCCDVMDVANNKIAGVYTGCKMRKGGKTFKVITDIKSGNFLVESLACTFMLCTGSNLFVRNSVINELEGFDEAFVRHQDYEFVVRLFEKYDLEAIRAPLVIKNNENTNVPNVYRMAEIKRQYLEKFAPVIHSLSQEQQKYIYHSHNIALAEYAMRIKDYKTAKHYYAIARKYYRLTFWERVRKAGFLIKSIFGI